MKNGAGVLVIAMGCLLAFCGIAAAEGAQDATALAKAAQNPLATLVTLPLQANYNSGVGEYDRTFFNLNVQPVVPFKVGGWNMIARTIIPINSKPVGEYESYFGLGDANMTLFFSPPSSGAVTWGVGPIFSFPTSSNPELLGTGKFSLGPSGVLFVSVGKWTMGGVASNVWSVAGDDNREDVNLFTAQYFLNFNFGHGLALGTAPIIVANWEAESGNQWTIPWGLQVSKVTRFGKQPVNLLAGYYQNTTTPEGGADRQVRLQLNFMFPITAN